MQSRKVRLPAFLYTERMTLWAQDPTTGAYVVKVAVNLPCRLCETSKKDILAGLVRAQGLEFRVLLFPPEVVMDPLYQVEINGHRFNLNSGSDQTARGPSGEIVYRTYDTVHAPSAGETVTL
jgi:hypothetical protein